MTHLYTVLAYDPRAGSSYIKEGEQLFHYMSARPGAHRMEASTEGMANAIGALDYVSCQWPAHDLLTLFSKIEEARKQWYQTHGWPVALQKEQKGDYTMAPSIVKGLLQRTKESVNAAIDLHKAAETLARLATTRVAERNPEILQEVQNTLEQANARIGQDILNNSGFSFAAKLFDNPAQAGELDQWNDSWHIKAA